MPIVTIKEPLVSVVVFTYNQQATIEQTLASIAEQNVDFPVEVLIGNDKSTDDTSIVIDHFIKNQENRNSLIVWHHIDRKLNLGLVKNFIALVEQSKGQYLATLAGDDYWIDKNKLRKQLAVMAEFPNTKLVHTAFLTEYITGEKKHVIFERDNGNIFNKFIEYNQVGALTAMYCRNTTLQCIADGIYKNGTPMEDYPLWLSLAKKGEVRFLDDITAVWRHGHESASISKSYKKWFKFEDEVIKIKINLTKMYGDDSTKPILKKVLKQQHHLFVKEAIKHRNFSLFLKYEQAYFLLDLNLVRTLKDLIRFILRPGYGKMLKKWVN